MNTKDYFKDVYEDFFGVEVANKLNNEEVVKEVSNIQEEMRNVFLEIDSFFMSDDTKNLLKQIIEYMRKYNEGIESNYIPFNIILKVSHREQRDKIVEIIKKMASMLSYVNNGSKEISMFHVGKDFDINKIYTDNGIIVFKDLDGFGGLDEEVKKRVFNDLERVFESNSHAITILVGSSYEVDGLFLGKEKFRDNYFSFVIESRSIDVQDIYQEVLEKINVSDDDKVKLLDYISSTINSVDDYVLYRDRLIQEISFNKKIPELEKEKTMDEVFASLNELVGLKKVKNVLHELADLKEFQEKANLGSKDINLHMVFLGNPGTGKTTVARLVANILYNLKYLSQNKLIEVSIKDLVAEYVGQTAPKTMNVIEKALGGVLFIDEAYTLAVKGDNSYNAEAIATLIQAMENYRDKFVVIFAGYTKEMQDFLNSNSGIKSRIGYTLEFDDYTEDELVEIFIGMVKKNGFKVNDEAIEYLREIIRQYQHSDNFGNARFIRNIYEKSVIKHASNTRGKKRKDILVTLTKDDITIENLILK